MHSTSSQFKSRLSATWHDYRRCSLAIWNCIKQNSCDAYGWYNTGWAQKTIRAYLPPAPLPFHLRLCWPASSQSKLDTSQSSHTAQSQRYATSQEIHCPPLHCFRTGIKNGFISNFYRWTCSRSGSSKRETAWRLHQCKQARNLSIIQPLNSSVCERLRFQYCAVPYREGQMSQQLSLSARWWRFSINFQQGCEPGWLQQCKQARNFSIPQLIKVQCMNNCDFNTALSPVELVKCHGKCDTSPVNGHPRHGHP